MATVHGAMRVRVVRVYFSAVDQRDRLAATHSVVVSFFNNIKPLLAVVAAESVGFG